MFSGGFKRSSRFGLIGVIVVMVLVAVIGLTMGSNDPNPKLALGLIFGVIAVFFVILFALQRGDLEKVAMTDVQGSERAAAEGGRAMDQRVRDKGLAGSSRVKMLHDFVSRDRDRRERALIFQLRPTARASYARRTCATSPWPR